MSHLSNENLLGSFSYGRALKHARGVLKTVTHATSKSSLLLFLIVAVGMISSSACLVGTGAQPQYGVASQEPPPPQYDIPNENRPGQFWVKGHWQWRGNQWQWQRGYWKRQQANQQWQDGRWERRGNRYHWVEGSFTSSFNGNNPNRNNGGGYVRDKRNTNGGYTNQPVQPRSGYDTQYPTQPPPAPRYQNPRARPGQTWIQGRYDWQNGRYQWQQGHWEQQQQGRQWQNGRWERRGEALRMGRRLVGLV